MYSGVMNTGFPLEVIACPEASCYGGLISRSLDDWTITEPEFTRLLKEPKPCPTCGGVGKVRIQKLEGADG